MPRAIDLRLQLSTRIWPSGAVWVAACPALDLDTQANTEAAAHDALAEAVRLWFESCLERGVLPEALAECGFTTAGTPQAAIRPEASSPAVTPRPGGRAGVLELSLPAWR